MKIKALFYISVVIFFTACTKEKIVEVEKIVEKTTEYKWKRHSIFKDIYAAVLNSYATADTLFLDGRSFFILEDSINATLTSESKCIGLSKGFGSDQNINYKNPINNTLYLNGSWSNGDYIFINQVSGKSFNYGDYQVNMKNYDVNFDRFDIQSSLSKVCIKLNNKNQLLIPYKNKTVDASYTYDANFLLMDFILVPYAGSYRIDTLRTKKIKIEYQHANTGNHYIDEVFTFKDYFIFSFNSNVYKLNSDGTLKIFNNLYFNNVFNKRDTLYATNYNSLFISTDEGNNWNQLMSGTLPNLIYYKFYQINNELVVANYSNLYHVIIGNNTVQVKELENNGLDGNYITSISQYRSRVYVTSLSGVYYRNLKNFFTYKNITKK